MKLFTMELRRFRSRRGNLVVLILGLMFLAGMLVTTMVNSHSPTDQEIKDAEAQAAADRTDTEDQREECQAWWHAHPEGGHTNQPPADASENEWNKWEYSTLSGAEECVTQYDPSDIDAATYLDGVVSFETEAPHQIGFLAAVTTVATLLMASSFVGAEWSSGGMTNLLLWQPRRLPVFAAKLGAAVTGGVALAIAYGILHLGGFWLLAKFCGQLGNIDATWWAHNGIFGLRLFTLVILASTVGVALSIIGRSTIAAISLLLGYFLLFEFGLRTMMMAVNIDIQRGLLSSYLVAWVNDGVTLYGPADNTVYIGDATGGIVVLLVSAAVVAFAGLSFSRSDAT